MNERELRTTLDTLAGPRPPSSPDALDHVMQRARRGRRRVRFGAAAAVVVLLAAGFGIVRAVDGGRTGRAPAVATTPAACGNPPRAVPGRRVPADVRAWAPVYPVVGHGSLWAVRRLLAASGIHDGAVWRLKISWFVRPAGPDATAPTLTAREVGGTARAIGQVNAATDERGTWFVSTIELPQAGCYEITARHGPDVIRFRRSVGGG